MTAVEFQSSHSGDLKLFLDSPAGKEFFTILNGLRPTYEFPVHEHLMMANREAIRGYEMCLRNILGLTMPPKITTQPEANYGVPDRKPTE